MEVMEQLFFVVFPGRLQTFLKITVCESYLATLEELHLSAELRKERSLLFQKILRNAFRIFITHLVSLDHLRFHFRIDIFHFGPHITGEMLDIDPQFGVKIVHFPQDAGQVGNIGLFLGLKVGKALGEFDVILLARGVDGAFVTVELELLAFAVVLGPEG